MINSHIFKLYRNEGHYAQTPQRKKHYRDLLLAHELITVIIAR